MITKENLFILCIFFIYFIGSGCSSKNVVNNTKRTSQIIHNENESISFLFHNGILDTISIKCDNNIAITEFGKRMKILKKYVVDKDMSNIGEIIYIITNFELLTGIESESDGDYIGKYRPTNRDFEKWEEWFEKHKNKICWYEEKRILYLRME